MAEKISVSKARATFSQLLADVHQGNKRFVIELQKKPVAALVSMTDLARLERELVTAADAKGALALLGAWQDVGDDALDALAADIYAGR